MSHKMDEYLQPIVEFVRENSPYFRELYADIPKDAGLTDLPVIDHTTYWAASSRDHRSILTSTQIDGVVMKTGGTTSRPKTTPYSQSELQRTNTLLANGLLAGGVRAGDRIANLFYAGELYGSFLLHTHSIPALPIPAVHLPIGSPNETSDAIALVEQCNATVLLTTATTLVKLASYLVSQEQTNTVVRTVLFGGEPLFADQEITLKKAFPRASIKGCIYGTIDSGVLATAAAGSDTSTYQSLIGSVILEILDDDKNQILENNVPGLLVATNTVRQLCPVIRYPTGDKAVWVDIDKGTFKLLGRASQAVRLGPVSIDMSDLRSVVGSSTGGRLVQGLQAVVSRVDGFDQLECVVAMHDVEDDTTKKEISDSIVANLGTQRPMFSQHVKKKLIAPLVVRFVKDIEDLQLARGSHKVIEVVENRFNN